MPRDAPERTQVRIELGRQGRSLHRPSPTTDAAWRIRERPHCGFGSHRRARARVTGLGGNFRLGRPGAGASRATPPLERGAAA